MYCKCIITKLPLDSVLSLEVGVAASGGAKTSPSISSYWSNSFSYS